MKKNSRVAKRRKQMFRDQKLTIGMDLGDQFTHYCVLDEAGMMQGARYILGPFRRDSDLRRWGLELSERGGSNAKKRAVVAVARKLSVLIHKSWVSGEVYEPLRNQRAVESTVA